MFVCMLYCGSLYHMQVWKVAVSAIAVTFAGVTGAYLMGLLESGSWGGRSYFGAVFLVPVIMWLVAKALKLPYGQLLDICAPAGCIMLAVLKIKCRIDGCCGGRFFPLKNGELIRFPSQIVESVVGLLLALILILINKKGTQQGRIYALYLIFYGIVRFVLSFLRYPHPWIGVFPAGAFWSLIAIALGILTLLVNSRRKKGGDAYG